MPKNPDSNGLEKTLLLVLSLISVGLLVAIVFVWYSALNKNSQTTKPGDFIQPQQTETPVASPSNTSNQASPSSQIQEMASVLVNSPKNEDIIYTKTTTLSGTAKPDSALTVTGGKEDLVEAADATGAFSLEVKLNEGANELIVTAFDELGNRVSQTVSVVYMPQ